MPLDESFIGRKYPPSPPYQVGREKIRDFATAIGATDAVHHDPAAARALGYRDVVAPPTFPIVITLFAIKDLITDPDFGADYSRVVHGEQRFAYARPVVAGDELVCVTTVEDVSTRAGHGFVTTRTEVRTTDGELVVNTWHKTVVRGQE